MGSHTQARIIPFRESSHASGGPETEKRVAMMLPWGAWKHESILIGSRKPPCTLAQVGHGSVAFFGASGLPSWAILAYRFTE